MVEQIQIRVIRDDDEGEESRERRGLETPANGLEGVDLSESPFINSSFPGMPTQ